MRYGDAILNILLSGTLKSDCELYLAIFHHNQLLKLLLIVGFVVGVLVFDSDGIFEYLGELENSKR